MKKFEKVAATEANPKWEQMIHREKPLYNRGNDLRTEFERDYTRIIYCNAYKRLKHKTQVFFSPTNDHVCTRIEHVKHVESISYTIAKQLGLNIDLTKAIASGHDLGHSPFGHQGEKVINAIAKQDLGKNFWHEQNGLRFVDKIELLEDTKGYKENLNLTYAVRDGIISHCGEIDENSIKPREKSIDLAEYKKPNEYSPYTWEACVMKIADKISYIARDIQDAVLFQILDKKKVLELAKILRIENTEMTINNTNITNDLICDLCQHSDPQKGLTFSKEKLELMNEIKKFNYQNIYLSDRLLPSTEYFELIIRRIYATLRSIYQEDKGFINLEEKMKYYPKLVSAFTEWIKDYVVQDSIQGLQSRDERKLFNQEIYDLRKEEDYITAVLDYIAGMTDNFAIEAFNEIISF